MVTDPAAHRARIVPQGRGPARSPTGESGGELCGSDPQSPENTESSGAGPPSIDPAIAPAIDRAALDAQTGGDADLAREVLALFAGQCRSILPRLTDPDLSLPERADLAHTLKGSAAGVGATRVQALADAAETRLRGEGHGDLGDLTDAVDAALRAIAEGRA
jgi:HPt (histidine-containing phosphotransfer) domain-containing protein